MSAGLLRSSAHSPSMFAIARAGAGGGAGGELVDFCIPCNPYFPTPGMFTELEGVLERVLKYYPSDADTITAELCGTLGLNPQTVAMGNGSTELITWIDHLLIRESMATPIPTFGRWTDQPMETGKRVDLYPLPEFRNFAFDVDSFVGFVRERGSRVAVVCNPNNPDGGYVQRREVLRLLDLLIDRDLVVIDESFIDFVDAEAATSVADEAAIRPNVIVLKSLGKNFGLHGIRFGYLVANPALAGKVRKMLPKWNLNSFAEFVVFLLAKHREEYRESLSRLAADRTSMFRQLSSLPGLKVFESQGNFLFVKLPDGKDGVELRDYLLNEHGVYVRECGNKLGSSSRFLRLVVRPQPDVQRLMSGLGAYLFGTEKARTASSFTSPSMTAPPSASSPLSSSPLSSSPLSSSPLSSASSPLSAAESPLMSSFGSSSTPGSSEQSLNGHACPCGCGDPAHALVLGDRLGAAYATRTN